MTNNELRPIIERTVRETPVVDIHTHLFPAEFGRLLFWGIDELLTYHYLVAETFRWIDMPYSQFWKMSKTEQADLVWRTLFLEHSPISEACRGVLTALHKLGIDTSSRDLETYRKFFAARTPEEYTETVFQTANVESAVMTNDPFDDEERPNWLEGKAYSPRFKAALRIDALLNNWPAAHLRLKEWGYEVGEQLTARTLQQVRQFLSDWLDKLDALYMAASLPPDFRIPEDSTRAKLITECVLPVGRDTGKPFAMMIGVKKLINPDLRLAGDGVGKSIIETVEHLCANYPHNKFMVTMLARENQHELCVTARKFRNLLIFGCWWFLNNPSIIEEMMRMRTELLGLSYIPQHSDCRVLDQLIYKWEHSRAILTDVLCDKYADLAATGWQFDEADIRRDVKSLLGGLFGEFLQRKLS